MLVAQCKVGGELVNITDDDAEQNPHVRLDAAGCSHCADAADHDHAASAANCPKTHDGPCWQGPQSGPRPDGCTVCRPVIFFANGVVGPVS